MPVKRKKYEFKLYINHKNNKLWDVIDWCDSKRISPSDFLCKAGIEKYESITSINTKRYMPEPEKPVQIKKILPPVLRDEEAEETERMLASGEWEIVQE